MYIYGKREQYGHIQLERFIFVKETATQIVTKRREKDTYFVRFSKVKQKEITPWEPFVIISFESYKELYNWKVNREINKLQIESDRIKKQMEILNAKIIQD